MPKKHVWAQKFEPYIISHTKNLSLLLWFVGLFPNPEKIKSRLFLTLVVQNEASLGMLDLWVLVHQPLK